MDVLKGLAELTIGVLVIVVVLSGLKAIFGEMPKSRRAGAEMVAWSAVHGISTLLTSPLTRALPNDRERMVAQVLDGVARSLQITS